ncbi:hypothetical protein [Pseudomonas sp. P8_241]|uniref:hypothetical protein n=1 Tax=Pseudomonas sp. P8_241 TaxID=3043445 RepID=UPI002A35BC6E|nr:hypothetical protein [Pseudomonas sp. P8_241]WPN49110.1 hypothetical protein QMK58_10755 [Pseudomonas sp. P8_241]
MTELMFVLSYRAFNKYLSKDGDGREISFMADMPEPHAIEVLGEGMVNHGYVTIECGQPDESYGSIRYNDPQFAIHTILPIDIFNMLLNTDLDTKIVLLTLTVSDNALNERGRLAVWDVEQSKVLKAEMINVTVKDIIKPESMPEPYPRPVLVTDPYVIFLLKVILGTIATIGVLILGRLYLG